MKSLKLAAVAAVLALVGFTLAAGPVAAAVVLGASPTSGPPTTKVQVTGSGLLPNEMVDVYFDFTDMVLAVTNATGNFSTSFTVPKSAVPGVHWVTACGRRSGLAIQKSFTVRTNWAQFHYGQTRTGYNPFENVLSSATLGDLGLAWVSPKIFPYASQIHPSPVVAGGTVYLGGNDGQLFALDAATGAVRDGWPVDLGAPITSSPAVAGGVVYVCAANGGLFAFYTGNGKPLPGFPVKTGGIVLSSPVVANGKVYLAADDKQLYAFSATSGIAFPGWPVSLGNGITQYSSPTVAYGRVYVGTSDGKLCAFDASTGASLPGWPRGTAVDIKSSPAVANGVVYVCSGIKLFAFKAVSGVPLSGWPVTVGAGAITSSPAIAYGRVYVGAGPVLYAFNSVTGALLPGWPVSLAQSTPGSNQFSSPAVANGVVYQAEYDSGSLCAVDAVSGSLLWQFSGSYIRSSPAVADGSIYLSDADGYLYAFNLTAGFSGAALKARQAAAARRPDPAALTPDYRLKPQK